MSKDHYDDPEIIKEIRNFAFDDEPADQVWQSFIRAYSQQGPVARRHDIKHLDSQIEEGAPLSRAIADTMARLRQLKDIDALLRKAGR